MGDMPQAFMLAPLPTSTPPLGPVTGRTRLLQEGGQCPGVQPAGPPSWGAGSVEKAERTDLQGLLLSGQRHWGSCAQGPGAHLSGRVLRPHNRLVEAGLSRALPTASRRPGCQPARKAPRSQTPG